ncbi:MAG: LysR family transcriptional regulator [Myxococcales bacterium]|nr:LysR family transcriptional regulator [Myxococcales bacterium]
MEFSQIRYVLAVYEARNFTRAAERCAVSQPSLTAAVKKLETELGGPLFHRDRAGARLSALGELLLPVLERIAEDQRRVGDVARKYQLLDQAPMRVGVQHALGPARLAPAVRAFQATAPGVEVELRTYSRDELSPRLEEGDIEVAIGVAPSTPPDWLIVGELYRESYVVVLPARHPLASRSVIALRDLHGVDYVDRLACEMRERLLADCARADIRLYASYRADDVGWIQALVRSSVGVAVLPEHSLPMDRHDLVSRPLEQPLTRTISLWRNVDVASSTAAKAFWRGLREFMEIGSIQS